MNSLPYLQPDKDFYLNVGIVMLIINGLAITKRKKKMLTLDILQTFYFLVTRPVFLNRVLEQAGKEKITMSEDEYYNVETLSVNFDELFDRDKLKLIIKFLASKKWLELNYNEKDGFLLQLNTEGELRSRSLSEEYFIKINRYINQLKLLQSENSSKLNSYINQVFKKGI